MADNVVIATNTPVYDPDDLRNHLHPEGSFVIGLYTNGDFPDGMFIENEPVHTYRTTPTDKGQMIIVAGEHSLVDVEDKNVYYDRLEKYAHQHLDVKSVDYRWSSYDSTTDDDLPIIGKTSQQGVYVATGFCFWGMLNGTTAGMVISDLITGKENQYADIFNPIRFTREYMAILKLRSAILNLILYFI
jgi:glycine/D-amino acid oxidase-like deaminating enzyme